MRGLRISRGCVPSRMLLAFQATCKKRYPQQEQTHLVPGSTKSFWWEAPNNPFQNGGGSKTLYQNGLWKHGPKPAHPLLLNFEPHPNVFDGNRLVGEAPARFGRAGPQAPSYMRPKGSPLDSGAFHSVTALPRVWKGLQGEEAWPRKSQLGVMLMSWELVPPF